MQDQCLVVKRDAIRLHVRLLGIRLVGSTPTYFGLSSPVLMTMLVKYGFKQHPIIFWVLFFSFMNQSKAQETILESIVLDHVKKPIPYVTVRIVGYDRGAYTNTRGYFNLKDISKSDSIEISHLGFKSLILPIASVLDTLTMELDTLILNEVIILSSVSKVEEIKIGTASGKIKNYFNLPSFELGSIYQLNFNQPRTLKKIEIPIKPPKNGAITRIKIYKCQNAQPEKLILAEEVITSRSSKLLSYTLGRPLIFEKECLFVSLELIKYSGTNAEFVMFEESKDALAVYMSHKSSSFGSYATRNFNTSRRWHKISSEDYGLAQDVKPPSMIFHLFFN